MTEKERMAQILLERAAAYLCTFIQIEKHRLVQQGIEGHESLKGAMDTFEKIRKFLRTGDV
jgi:hypothetical protein